MKRQTWVLPILILLSACYLSGCSTTTLGARFTCLEWKAQGLMFSTLDSCTKCVQAHGTASIEQVQGWALGMDASVLMNLPTQ